MGAEVRYIPGTNIPSMSGKFGPAIQKAGIAARTAGLTEVQNKLNKMIAGGIVAVVGGKALQANMVLVMGRIAGALEMGLGDAVSFIRYDMDKTPPIIPVGPDRYNKGQKYHAGGTLRASWFQRPVRDKPGTVQVLAGFSANYAVYVHEMTDEAYGKKINWTRPDSGPKFLEKALKRNTDEVVNIIIQNVRMVMK